MRGEHEGGVANPARGSSTRTRRHRGSHGLGTQGSGAPGEVGAVRSVPQRELRVALGARTSDAPLTQPPRRLHLVEVELMGGPLRRCRELRCGERQARGAFTGRPHVWARDYLSRMSLERNTQPGHVRAISWDSLGTGPLKADQDRFLAGSCSWGSRCACWPSCEALSMMPTCSSGGHDCDTSKALPS
jgi:hypothetical protein